MFLSSLTRFILWLLWFSIDNNISQMHLRQSYPWLKADAGFGSKVENSAVRSVQQVQPCSAVLTTWAARRCERGQRKQNTDMIELSVNLVSVRKKSKNDCRGLYSQAERVRVYPGGRRDGWIASLSVRTAPLCSWTKASVSHRLHRCVSQHLLSRAAERTAPKRLDI